MALFVAQINCPHCGTKKSAFRGSFYTQIRLDQFRVPLSCSHCNEMVIGDVETMNGTDPKRWPSEHIFNLDVGDYLLIVDMYPKEVSDVIPSDLPDRIHSNLLKALDNKSRGHFDVAVMLCGKILDIATQEMDQAWSLDKRLKKLAADGRLAPQMADWAEEMRLDRNIAAHHDDEFTEEQADQIIEFCRAFLTYLYTLPAKIEQRRRDRGEGSN